MAKKKIQLTVGYLNFGFSVVKSKGFERPQQMICCKALAVECHEITNHIEFAQEGENIMMTKKYKRSNLCGAVLRPKTEVFLLVFKILINQILKYHEPKQWIYSRNNAPELETLALQQQKFMPNAGSISAVL